MPALKNPSLIVLDNASYHNVKTENTVCPNFSQKKVVLQNYLTQHNIPFSGVLRITEITKITLINQNNLLITKITLTCTEITSKSMN
jgi:hypothetical protein